jgi:hypothetical protein
VNAAVVRIGSQGFQDVFVVVWLVFWSLSPSLVLGFVSGRWWSFVGAAPVLFILPFGLLVGSSGNEVTGSDVFLTLPVAAAVAVALSAGSAARLVRQRGRPPRQPTPPMAPTVAASASAPFEKASIGRATTRAIPSRGPGPATWGSTSLPGRSASDKPSVKRRRPEGLQARAVWALVIGSVWVLLGVAGALTVAPGDRVDFAIGWVVVAGPIALAIWLLGQLLRGIIQRLGARHHGGPPASVR